MRRKEKIRAEYRQTTNKVLKNCFSSKNIIDNFFAPLSTLVKIFPLDSSFGLCGKKTFFYIMYFKFKYNMEIKLLRD